jgi:hypothetical protein
MLCLNCCEKEAVEKFCTRSCAASYNNRLVPKRSQETKIACCLGCSIEFTQPMWASKKYCNVACYKDSVKSSDPKNKLRKSIAKYTVAERSEVLSACAVSQGLTAYNSYIAGWKGGVKDGMKGKTSISSHIRRYLFEKFESKCVRCGWCQIHPTTNKVPLEVEHLDGNFRNNKEDNLALLCPNCHSLTPTYRALNRGRGRPRK